MHRQDAPLIWTMALVCAIFAAYALYRFLSSVKRDRYFADTPLAKIRSAAQGFVRLEGQAGTAPGENATAPLSGRACVWWDYQIARRQAKSRGKNEWDTTWDTIETATSVAPFTLSDGDSNCLVGPVGAEVTATSTDVWYGITPKPLGLPPQLSALISGEGDYRYTERIIAPGAHLSVLGELRSHSAATELNDHVRALLATWKTDQSSLLARFDRNHDGQIDAEEWEAARAAAQREVEAAVGHSATDRISVVAQSAHGEPFLISPLKGPDLLRRERRHAVIALVASIVFVTLTVWAIEKALTLQAVS
jgi:hypothetical protein